VFVFFFFLQTEVSIYILCKYSVHNDIFIHKQFYTNSKSMIQKLHLKETHYLHKIIDKRKREIISK
jgi:hypothetical protein